MWKYGKNLSRLIFILFISLPLVSCGAMYDITHVIQDYKTKRVIGEANLEPLKASLNEYTYQTLNQEEKLTYDQLYECMDLFLEKVPLTTRDEDLIKKCFDCVLSDYGEKFYWVESYSVQIYRSKNDNYISGITFSPQYSMTLEEKEVTDMAIEEVYNQWIEDLPLDSSDYEKSKYVYNKLISEVDYDADAPDNQNIKSVFLNKATVCKGYANSVSYFFDKLGIPCTVVTGEANDGPHAWNLVLLDGDYYYYDVTWGNSSYRNSELKEKRVNYSYLNVTGEEIFKTHEIKVDFPLPECVSTKDNYFVKEGLFFDYENFDTYGEKMREGFLSGVKTLSFRFANKELYDKVFDNLIIQKKFPDYCPGLTRISYLEDEEVLTLTFIFLG